MKKLGVILGLTLLVGCTDVLSPTNTLTQGFLIVIDANTNWIGKIDTFTVSGDSTKWFVVNRPGVCWTFTKTKELGMVRAFGTTPDFKYGDILGKYKMWGDMNTVMPYETIRGCIPEDARY